MRFLVLLVAAICFSLMGCKGDPIVGKYHIEQDANGFGPGAEKTELDLKSDRTFDITIGPVPLAKGTYTFDAGRVELSEVGGASLGTSYRVEGSKLVPMVNGKPVTFWRFVKM